jgi:hypothetical protein
MATTQAGPGVEDPDRIEEEPTVVQAVRIIVAGHRFGAVRRILLYLAIFVSAGSVLAGVHPLALVIVLAATGLLAMTDQLA